MNKKHFYAIVILLSLLAIGIQPAIAEVHTLVPGANTEFGTWSENDKLFTFHSSPDVGDSIEIINQLDAYLIIDGDGNTIDLEDNSGGGIGVNVYNSSYITIMNLNVTNCSTGITLGISLNGVIYGVNHIDLIDNNVSNCQHGIYMFRAGTCISEPGRSGITGNNIISNWWGIEVHSCVSIDIYNNNFVDNDAQAELKIDSSNPANLDIDFDLDLPTGGNYWSDYIGLDDGTPYLDTIRVAGDGIGDTLLPHAGVDIYPLMPPPTPQDEIVELIFTVAEMNLHQGIENSLDAKLDAAFNALDDMNENNDVAAINSLNAFINAVEAQRGKKITNEQADTLIAAAQAIIDML
ncbi:MAG: hypothetical protein H8D56_05715 [Planctomycetes bacterium]|nr:hypothetical protein [Planctomycetota bacterium]MBL7145446.1 hypothetical protein [Phycisphaerae bacterium]